MSRSIDELIATINLVANIASIAAAYQFSNLQDSAEDPVVARERHRNHELTVLSDDPRIIRKRRGGSRAMTIRRRR